MHSLKNFINNVPLKTITVDVFDTVLLRRVYPEALQFALHGRRCVKILRERTGIPLSPIAFATLRRSARRGIDSEHRHQGFDPEAGIEEIFRALLEQLLAVQGKILPEQEKQEIIQLFIAEEIALEKRCLRPDHGLLRILASAKEKKGVRLYFLSDMYLSRMHITSLFEHFGIIGLFDGGMTSADLGYSKGSGKLYERVLRGGVIDDFVPALNLHIGDHPHADRLNAVSFACCTFLRSTWHHRCYRPLMHLLGGIPLWFLHRKALHSWSVTLRRAERRQKKILGREQYLLYRTGLRIFGPALLQYSAYLGLSAMSSARPIFFFSREAPFLGHLLNLFHAGKTPISMKVLPTLNRISILRTLAYMLLTQTEIRDSVSILNLFWQGEAKHTIEDFLESLGLTKNHLGLSDLVLRQFRKHEFNRYVAALCDDPVRGGIILEPMRLASDKVLLELQRTGFFDQRKAMIGDVGWHGSMQILLEHIMVLRGNPIDLRGIYVGNTGRNLYALPQRPNIEGVLFDSLETESAKRLSSVGLWEQVIIRAFTDELHPLRDGIEECFSLWRSTRPLSPEILYAHVLSRIVRFFWKPTRREVSLFASLTHTPDMGVSQSQPLVEIGLPFSLVWRLFLGTPKKFQRLLDRQVWQGGFLTWFRLHPFLWMRSLVRHSDGELCHVHETRIDGLYEIPRTPVSMCRPPHTTC